MNTRTRKLHSITFIAACTILTALLSTVLPAAAAPGDTEQEARAYMTDYEEEVLDLVNARRVEHGCATLFASYPLAVAARKHSVDLATNIHDLDHTGSDGSDVGERIEREGYAWQAWAENLSDYPTAAEVVDAWMNSQGHRANILNCALLEAGVGYAQDNEVNRDYTTMVFATPLE